MVSGFGFLVSDFTSYNNIKMATFNKIEDIEAWVLTRNICKEIYTSYKFHISNPKFKEVLSLGFWNLCLENFKEYTYSTRSGLMKYLNSSDIKGIKFNKQSEPETINHKPETINHKPETINHKPETINHKPETINHKP